MATELTELVLTYQRLLASNRPKDTSRRIELYTRLCDACRIIFYTYPVKVHVLQEEDAVEELLLGGSQAYHQFHIRTSPFEHYVPRSPTCRPMCCSAARRAECSPECIQHESMKINGTFSARMSLRWKHTTMDP